MSTENLSQSGKEEALVSFGDIEKLELRGMLYDFYGELLTPHQQEIYESIIFQDLSLSEVAEIHGISRQGVHDLVRRCDKLLEGYENKLHLVERFVTLKSSVSELRELTKAYEKSRDDKLFGQIDRLCQTILEEL